MTRIASRVLAAALVFMLLPGLAFSSDGNSASNNAPANSANTAAPGAPAAPPAAVADPLLRLMVAQGLVTAEEVGKLAGVPSSELRDRLLLLLLTKNKTSLTAADLNALNGSATATSEAAPADATVSGLGQQTGPPQPPKTPPPSGPIPAIAPIRVMQVDPAKHEGFIPDIKIGKSINIKPYGFIKASAVYDTSSPYGNDFPLPGFIGDINTVDAMPEFHVKARFIRLGSNFEWLDTPKVVVTGKIEADFEGNFSRANNRNISSIRSNMFSFRVGYGRIDFRPSDTTSVFALFGQDWTPFASSTLPNLFETTGLGVGFGSLYERAPQFRAGLQHKFGGMSFAPEVAVVYPAFGNLPLNVADQLGYGERQGADSARPEVQGRLVFQFQADHAAGVAPAQIIASGMYGKRNVVVRASDIPAAFKAAFPTGLELESDRHGFTGEIQIPTRFMTVIAKYYNGTDLRFYFGGQLLTQFNDTTGLTGTATAPSIDGSSTVVLGNRAGVPVVASQFPGRSQGGFVNVGFPLSRIFNADPAGRNAGWAFYLHYGQDSVFARDVRRFGGGRNRSDVGAGTLQYKLNNFVTFVLEESYYRTHAIPLTSTGQFPLFQGRPTEVWKDFRSEFGPLFTF